MKAGYYIFTLCVLPLTGGACFAGNPISEAQAIGVAKKAVSPLCAKTEQCVVTTKRKDDHWFVTLQVASKSTKGYQILEVGNFRTVEVNESGKVVSIAPGK